MAFTMVKILLSGMNPYLMAIFTLTWTKYPVVQRIQWVVKVGLLKAVVVQNLQSVENPPNSEAWQKLNKNCIISNCFHKM